MKPMTGVILNRAKTGMTMPATPRMTSPSVITGSRFAACMAPHVTSRRKPATADIAMPAVVPPRRSAAAGSALDGWRLVRTRSAASPFFAPLDLIEVESAIGEIAHSSLGASPRKIGEVHVADCQRLDVLGGLRGNSVAREREIACGQNAALCVLDVNVRDIREITDVAAQHHEALVLDRPRGAAIADPHVAL